MLTKVEKVDPIAAEEAEEAEAAAAHGDGASVRHARRSEFDDDDEDDENISLYEELLDGEDETYDHIQGKVPTHLLKISFTNMCIRARCVYARRGKAVPSTIARSRS